MNKQAKVKFKEKSPADFFYDNRDVAGFDNPARAIYTAIRELVENSLDSAELGGFLPNIEVEVKKVGEKVYMLRVSDNGTGIPPEQIPNCFGKVLYSSKYILRQSRGRFGMGGTMAVLYGQITTNKPVHVISSTGNEWIADMYVMIDIERNEPIVKPERLEDALKPNPKRWHGTIVELYLEGDYQRARKKVVEYLKQTAMITPYARIKLVEPDGNVILFKRAVRKLPKIPKETLPHPQGIDMEMLRRMLRAFNAKNMVQFMVKSFQRVGEVTAKEVLSRAGIPFDKRPQDLTEEELLKLYKTMKEYNGFLPPDPSCLAPVGEILVEGIKKELKPEFVAMVQRKPSAYEGHPFIVEVAIAYGGEIKNENGKIKLYRFANRIPLLYDEYNDVSAKVIRELNWGRYGIRPDMPIAVFVHICSTKIPFKTLGKEYIAHKDEIEREIKLGLMAVARELGRYLKKKAEKELLSKKRKTFLKYAELSSMFISEALGVKKEEVYRFFLDLIDRRVEGEEGEAEHEDSSR